MSIVTPRNAQKDDAPALSDDSGNKSSSRYTNEAFKALAKEWWRDLVNLGNNDEEVQSYSLAVLNRVHPGCSWYAYGRDGDPIKTPIVAYNGEDIEYSESQLLKKWLEVNSYKIEVEGSRKSVMIRPALPGGYDIPLVTPLSEYYLIRHYDNTGTSEHGSLVDLYETASFESALALRPSTTDVVAVILRDAIPPVQIWSTEWTPEQNFEKYGTLWTEKEAATIGMVSKARKIKLVENKGLGNYKVNKGLYVFETPSGSNARVCRKAPNGQWIILNLHAPLLHLLRLEENQESINWSLKFTRATDSTDPMRLIRENDWSTTRAVELDAGSKTKLSMMMDVIIEESVNGARDYLTQQGKKF